MKATKWRSWPRHRCQNATKKWWELGEGGPQKYPLKSCMGCGFFMESLDKFSGFFFLLEVDIKENTFLLGEVFFPDFLRRLGVFFSLDAVSRGLWQFFNRIHYPSWPTNEGGQARFAVVFFSREAGGGIFMFKKVLFLYLKRHDDGTKISFFSRNMLMVIQTLALDKELSTIYKPSHVMTFVYLLSELLFCFCLVYPSVPEVGSRCSLSKLEICQKTTPVDCNSSCC